MMTPSNPVKAMIWACRTDGIATKVIRGLSSLLSLFSNLRRGFWTEVVCAVGVEVGWMVMLNDDKLLRRVGVKVEVLEWEYEESGIHLDLSLSYILACAVFAI
jgi:hypothetical protein